MLSAYLEKADKAIAFQIVHQDDEITAAIKQNGSYTASNGWTFKIEKAPELDIRTKTIYLRGYDKSMDLRIDRTWDLESNYNRDLYINQVDDAIRQLVNWAVMPKYLVALEPSTIEGIYLTNITHYTEGLPTPLKNVIVANKPILRK